MPETPAPKPEGAPGPEGNGRDAAPAPEGAGPDLPAQLEVARREAAEWRERAARARADYDNLQRRTARDAQLERERNRARVLEGFLPLLELAHMAAQQAGREQGALAEGMLMLAREFERFAEREGLTRIGQVGERVDPARHEVVATEAADGIPAGCVSRVVQPGFLLGDRVLRFAKVCAAPGPPAPAAAPAGAASADAEE
jgi:molecular chaperone GrpE